MTSAHTIMGRTDKLPGMVKILGEIKPIPEMQHQLHAHALMLQIENEIDYTRKSGNIALTVAGSGHDVCCIVLYGRAWTSGIPRLSFIPSPSNISRPMLAFCTTCFKNSAYNRTEKPYSLEGPVKMSSRHCTESFSWVSATGM